MKKSSSWIKCSNSGMRDRSVNPFKAIEASRARSRSSPSERMSAIRRSHSVWSISDSHGWVMLRLPDECHVILGPLFRQRQSWVFSCEAVERLSPSDIVRSMHECGKRKGRGSFRADHELRSWSENPLDSTTALRSVQEVVAVGCSGGCGTWPIRLNLRSTLRSEHWSASAISRLV